MYAAKTTTGRRTGRQRNAMAGRAGVPVAASQHIRGGRAGLNVGDVSINYSAAPEGEAAVIQRRGRAVLGRRVEPYDQDIKGFIAICNSEQVDSKQQYIDKMIVKNKWMGRSQMSGGYQNIPNTQYVYIVSMSDDIYKNSVNVWVKRKIYERSCKEKSNYDDYIARILNIKGWTIEKNRNWIRTGDANGATDHTGTFGGTGAGSQFRLIGLEKIEDKIFNDNTRTDEFDYPNKQNGSEDKRKIKIHILNRTSFKDDSQKKHYSAAFINTNKIPSANFIAYAVNNLSEEPLLCSRQERRNKIFPVEIAPTVLAQEIEQLNEAEYKFATISSFAEKKVIALPKAKADKIQEEANQSPAQPKTPEIPGEPAVQAVPDEPEALVTEQR